MYSSIFQEIDEKPKENCPTLILYKEIVKVVFYRGPTFYGIFDKKNGLVNRYLFISEIEAKKKIHSGIKRMIKSDLDQVNIKIYLQSQLLFNSIGSIRNIMITGKSSINNDFNYKEEWENNLNLSVKC
jgi:hypothetical protein